MDDSQSPPDAENRKGDSERRAGLRLRDAEVVAATRRDMFGDGSLLDALGSHPLPREQEQSLAAASAEPAQPQPPNPVEAVEERPQMPAAVAPDLADPVALAAAPEAAPEPAQSLDAIIDSFPADSPRPTSEEALPEPQADPGFLTASPFALLDQSSDAAGVASDQVPAAAPKRFQVSAIFEGLGSTAPDAVEDNLDANGHDAPGDASALTDAHPPEPATGAPPGDADDATAAQQPTPATLNLRMPLFYQPQAAPPMPPPSDWPPMDAPAADGDAPPSDTGTPPPYGDTSELPPLPGSDTDSTSTEAADRAQAAATEPEPFPEPLGWPPFPEPPGSQGADPHVAPLEPPSLVDSSRSAADASVSPFPPPPAWPPYPESPGAHAGLSAAGPSGLPPYIELPAHPESAEDQATPLPAFGEPPPPGAAPSFGLPPDPFSEESASTDARFAGGRRLPAFTGRSTTTDLPEPQDVARFHDLERDWPALDSADARTSTEGTEQITAEANATAQALDNLQRLLNKTISPPAPPPQPRSVRPQAPPRRPHNAHLHLPQDDPFAHEMPPMLPLRMSPPMSPRERGVDRSVYLLGFFTGLVLSVMAGAALYFLINAG